MIGRIKIPTIDVFLTFIFFLSFFLFIYLLFSQTMATSLDNTKGNIVIVGATGNSGLQLVEQALARNYKVTAPVRNPDKLAHLAHKNLEVNYCHMF
jgi:cation diffusion facilitator CzcD-associated flavoprotein CzcO